MKKEVMQKKILSGAEEKISKPTVCRLLREWELSFRRCYSAQGNATLEDVTTAAPTKDSNSGFT